MTQKKGFSLVELLVAMAIIAVLISIAAYGIQIVQRNARNTRRRKMLDDILLTMKDYEINTGTAPLCFGSGGDRHHISFHSGEGFARGCRGQRLGEFDLKHFNVGTFYRMGTDPCQNVRQPETKENTITFCHDYSNRIIGVRLEGSSDGYEVVY